MPSGKPLLIVSDNGTETRWVAIDPPLRVDLCSFIATGSLTAFFAVSHAGLSL
jgi:hypothetical protein